jgi:predicted TIM-barrel fold metal-dependent hydrolase
VTALSPIDGHVHIVGNGARGSGCWLRLHGLRRFLAALMLRALGMPQDTRRADFDELYVARLLAMVRDSSLGAAVILAQEEVYDERGARLDFGSFHVPNDYVLELARQHPEFLPCVSIHPARADALEELERCLAAGAVMLKLLPNCHNVDCGDPRYTRFWERMAEARLPLLAHTGGEATVPVLNAALADPERLTRPLEIGMTVIAAHCGTRTGLRDPDYFPVFAEMTQRFPNLYGDNSAFNLPMRGEHTRAAASEPLASRLVYGSDLPVHVSGVWAWARGFIDWPTYRSWEKHPNPLERDYQLKRAAGFPEETFTRLHALLRPH